MKVFAKIVRILTLAPVMALATLLTLFFVRPEVFGEGALRFWLAIGFLVAFPLLGYPCQPLPIAYRDHNLSVDRALCSRQFRGCANLRLRQYVHRIARGNGIYRR